MMITTSLVWAALATTSYATLYNLTKPSDSATALNILSNTSFDYIIVGGGTAALTIAERLTELPWNKVLVLEAGGSGVGRDLVTIPENSFHFVGTDLDWAYRSVPQPHAANRVLRMSYGKALGGESAVNGLVWVRGAKEEYDAIEGLGNPSWNWNNLYLYMRKSEKLNPPSQELHDEFGFVVNPLSHGLLGPVDASFPKFLPLQHQKLIDASVEVGHNFNPDPYRGHNEGACYSLSSQTNSAVRETSEFAYFTPNMNRPNLIVFQFAMVQKVNLVPAAGGKVKATGVQIIFPDGNQHTGNIKSSGEVIVSTGAIRTPQILELSGIGDPAVLQPLGIDVKVNLPGVGTNFEDHTLIILTYQLKPGYLSFDALRYNQTLLEEQTELYNTQRKGWLTFAQGVVNFEPIDKILTPSERAHAVTLLQTKPPSISQEQFDIIKDQILNKGTPQGEFLLFNSFSAGTNQQPNTSYISFAMTGVHPLSRGTIHINTTSVLDRPVINPNILDSDWDLWWMSKLAAYGRKLAMTSAFQEILEPGEIWPGLDIQTEEQWMNFTTNFCGTGSHTLGTASMLPREKNGVVNPNLVVYGTTNLRVADMSIVPITFSAHTQTVAYAVAEKAADIIKLGFV